MDLKQLLSEHSEFGPILDIPYSKTEYLKLDFSDHNLDLNNIDLKDTKSFNAFVFNRIKKAGAKVGYGGYNEDRVIYKRSGHFQSEEPRSVHLGIDLWAAAYTPVFAPIDSYVHSFADNEGMGNYGPTIILVHKIYDTEFFTLYGHLSRKSIEDLQAGKPFKKGERIGEIGDFPENGDWPPHLHFQIIMDMLDFYGDFPGVAKPSDREKYLGLCPDPELILRYGEWL